ncbi:hypothetical protein F511_08599 [Dorcoceras hygrometricum]|uniref:Uncharacterized protein n=1 Tax=Dorcoceras hygrometricum TaxID=472368 RepID=A0A2Z7BJH6_9LAMI|nr:hypothetical protein F511_08599 [Dorcoceras hygrometricum]
MQHFEIFRCAPGAGSGSAAAPTQTVATGQLAMLYSASLSQPDQKAFRLAHTTRSQGTYSNQLMMVNPAVKGRCIGLVHATAASARELSTTNHSIGLACQLAPDLIQLTTTQKASKKHLSYYKTSALRHNKILQRTQISLHA